MLNWSCVQSRWNSNHVLCRTLEIQHLFMPSQPQRLSPKFPVLCKFPTIMYNAIISYHAICSTTCVLIDLSILAYREAFVCPNCALTCSGTSISTIQYTYDPASELTSSVSTTTQQISTGLSSSHLGLHLLNLLLLSSRQHEWDTNEKRRSSNDP